MFYHIQAPTHLLLNEHLLDHCACFYQGSKTAKEILSKKKSAGKSTHNDEKPQPLKLSKQEDYEQRGEEQFGNFAEFC